MPAKTEDQIAIQTWPLRQWICLTIIYLLIPLILFACGGDVGWWQAWIFSLMIVAVGVGGRMWAERRHPGLLVERDHARLEKSVGVKSWDKVLSPLMAVSISFPLVIVAGLDHRFGWSPVFPIWLTILGLVFIAIGYTLAAWALAENRFFSSMLR